MIFVFKLLSIIMGFLFPLALIEAIHAKNENSASKGIALSCVSFGIIVLTIMFLLPNN